MKKIVSLFLLGFLTLASYSQGLNFENQELKATLSRAKALNKPVLLVAYAENNMSLQMLINYTLYPDSVSTVLNARFVNGMLYSKTPDGKAFLEKYNIVDFPAVLILNPQGELIAKHFDLIHLDDPINYFNLVHVVLQDNRTLKKFSKEYAKNKNNSDFLKSYLYATIALKEPNHELLDVYLKSLTETQLHSPDVLQLLVHNADLLREKTFACEFLLKQKASNNAGNALQVQFLLNKLALNTIKYAAVFNNPKKIDEANGLYGVDPVTSSLFVPDLLNMEYFRLTNNFKEFKNFAIKYFDQCLMRHQPKNDQEKALMINRILVAAECCMKYISDMDLLNRSLEWLGKAIELDSTNQMAQLLQANILYKTGKVEDAKAKMGYMIQKTNTSKMNLTNYYREVHKKMYANQLPW